MSDQPAHPGPPPPPPPSLPATSDPEDSTWLPGLRTWRAVYALVLGAFVMYVVVLYVLTRAYR